MSFNGVFRPFKFNVNINILGHLSFEYIFPWTRCNVAFLFFKRFFKRFYLFIFRGREREGEREGEKYQSVSASHMPRTGDLAHNPGMCPDWELNC